jgi:protein ImuB
MRRAVARIAGTLHVLAPRVEPSREEPGLFWVGVEGLVPLRPSLQSWAGAVRAALAGEGFAVRVAAGFTRFGVYAAARSGRTAEVFHDPRREREEARRVPLALLRAGAEFLRDMDLLGVRTVGDLLALPAAGLEARFGPEAAALRRFAAADLPDPLEPEPEEERFLHREILESPEADAGRLLALVERALPPLFARVEERGRAAAEILLSLRAADGTRTGERLRPGTPTLDPAAALELLRLRIEALRLRSGVEEMSLEAIPVPLQRRQGRLFREEKGRDRAPAARAFARLRAEFGAGTVVRAALRDAHLPEASFSWEPLEALRAPRPGPGRPVLVRRVLDRPAPLPHRSPHEPDG